MSSIRVTDWDAGQAQPPDPVNSS